MFHCFFLLRLLQFFDVLFWPLPRWKPHLKTAGPNRWNRWSDREAKPMDSNKAVRSIIKFDLIFCFCLFYFFLIYLLDRGEGKYEVGGSIQHAAAAMAAAVAAGAAAAAATAEGAAAAANRPAASFCCREGGGGERNHKKNKSNKTEPKEKRKKRKGKHSETKQLVSFFFFMMFCCVRYFSERILDNYATTAPLSFLGHHRAKEEYLVYSTGELLRRYLKKKKKRYNNNNNSSKIEATNLL